MMPDSWPGRRRRSKDMQTSGTPQGPIAAAAPESGRPRAATVLRPNGTRQPAGYDPLGYFVIIVDRSRSAMTEARNLVKRYGSTVAVNDLSFSIWPGLVTGFLGPNGAGNPDTGLWRSLPRSAHHTSVPLQVSSAP
jgi:ATPase subunit of ABC transporter with duplicated ATPase domains